MSVATHRHLRSRSLDFSWRSRPWTNPATPVNSHCAPLASHLRSPSPRLPGPSGRPSVAIARRPNSHFATSRGNDPASGRTKATRRPGLPHRHQCSWSSIGRFFIGHLVFGRKGRGQVPILRSQPGTLCVPGSCPGRFYVVCLLWGGSGEQGGSERVGLGVEKSSRKMDMGW